MDYKVNYREDGRIELICSDNGTGHTIYAPKIVEDGKYFENYVHGCDGCCGRHDFKVARAKQFKEYTNALAKELIKDKETLRIYMGL